MDKQRIADSLGIDASDVPDAKPLWDGLLPDDDVQRVWGTDAGSLMLTEAEAHVVASILSGETVTPLRVSLGDFKPGTALERTDEPEQPPDWEFMLPTDVRIVIEVSGGRVSSVPDRDCFRVPRAKAWLNDDGTVTFTRWSWDTSDGHDRAMHRGLATVPAKVWDCYHAWWLKGWSANKAIPAIMEVW